MSQPLLDIHPVSFRAYFPGSSRYHIVTTVLDHVMYNTIDKREEILNSLKSDSLTTAVEDEIRAVCREVLAGADCPQAIHQRHTTIHISGNSDSVATSSECHRPPAFTLVVAINPEGSADRLWGSVASRLHQFALTDRTAGMLPPRRSRRLSIMPESSAAQPAGRARPAGRGSRASKPTSPARRPTSPGARRGRGATASPPAPRAPQRATRAAGSPPAQRTSRAAASPPAQRAARAAASPPAQRTSRAAGSPPAQRAARAAASPPAQRTSRAAASPPAQRAARAAASPPAQRATRAAASPPAQRAARAAAAPAARRTVITRKKTASPASAASTASASSRSSTAARSSRRAENAGSTPAPAAARSRQASRRGRAASPPRKSSLSPVKDRAAARATRKVLSPSFAKEIRVRTLRGLKDERMDFELPAELAESKHMLLEELFSNPTVLLETPGVLKRFSKKLKESTPKTKSPENSPDRSTKSAAKTSAVEITKRRTSPRVSPVRADGGRVTRGSKDSSSASTRKVSVKPAADRGRTATVEKRARAESRSPSATPPKKTRVTAAESVSRVTAAAATVTDSPSPESVSEKRARPSLASVRKSLNASLAAVPKTAASPASPVLRVRTPAVTPAAAAVKVTRTVVAVSQSVTEAEVPAVRSTRRAAAPSSALESPERAAGVKALLAARSSIRRRPATQPPPEQLSASPNLKPARQAADAALSRAYRALAHSEAKQKDLFRSRVTETAAAASPALAKPAEKPVSQKTNAEDTPAEPATKKPTARSQTATKVVSEEPPAEPVPSKPRAESAPEKAATEQRRDAVDGSQTVFVSPAGGATPPGQLAPRSSVRRAPASALRRVLDRVPDSAVRSSARRVLRRPSPPAEEPDQAAGGDSPLVEPRLTRSRRAKLASEAVLPAEGRTQGNNVNAAGLKSAPVTQPPAEKTEKELPQRRSAVRTACLMLLLLVVVVLGVLWLSSGQLPEQQQQQLHQLQLAVQQQGQRLAQLVQQQAETVRDWLGRQQAVTAADQQ